MTNCFHFFPLPSLSHSPFLDTFPWVWGWERWGVDVSRWAEQTVICAGEDFFFFVCLRGFMERRAFLERKDGLEESAPKGCANTVSVAMTQLLSICIQVHANKLTVHRNMGKNMWTSEVHAGMNGISESKSQLKKNRRHSYEFYWRIPI